MARTNSKSAASAQTVDFAETKFADSVSQEESKIDMEALFASVGIKMPSSKRVVCTFIANFAVGFLGGALASIVIKTLVIAVALSTGSLAMCWAMYILAWIVAVYALFAAGRAATQYIMSGSIDKDYASAKSWVGGLFKSKPLRAA